MVVIIRNERKTTLQNTLQIMVFHFLFRLQLISFFIANKLQLSSTKAARNKISLITQCGMSNFKDIYILYFYRMLNFLKTIFVFRI